MEKIQTQPTIGTPLDWPKEFTAMKEIDSLLRCAICYEYLDISMMITKCSHNYCSVCIRRYISYRSECPSCRESTTEKDLSNNRILDEIVQHFTTIRNQLLAAVSSYANSNRRENALCKDTKTTETALNGVKNVNVLPSITKIHKDKWKSDKQTPSRPLRNSSNKATKCFSKKLNEEESDSSDSDIILCEASDEDWCPSDDDADFTDKTPKFTSKGGKRKRGAVQSSSPKRTKLDDNSISRQGPPPAIENSSMAPTDSVLQGTLEGKDSTEGVKCLSQNSTSSSPKASPWNGGNASSADLPCDGGISMSSSPPPGGASQLSEESPSLRDKLIGVVTPSPGTSSPLVVPSPGISSPLVTPSTPIVSPLHKVPCPVCGVEVPQRNINLHLDRCLTASQRRETTRTMRRKGLPRFVYGLMSDKEIRRKLSEVDLPTQGNRQAMVKRHQEFTLLYNAQCDAINPKSAKEIVQEMLRNEKQKSQAAVFNTNAGKLQMEKGASGEHVEKAQQDYIKTHKSHFSQLIAAARKTALKKQPLPKLHPQIEDGSVDEDAADDSSNRSSSVPSDEEDTSRTDVVKNVPSLTVNEPSNSLNTSSHLADVDTREATPPNNGESVTELGSVETKDDLQLDTTDVGNRPLVTVVTDLQPLVTKCIHDADKASSVTQSGDLFPSPVSASALLAPSDDSNQSCGRSSRMSDFSTDLPLTQASRSHSPAVSTADSDSLFTTLTKCMDKEERETTISGMDLPGENSVACQVPVKCSQAASVPNSVILHSSNSLPLLEHDTDVKPSQSSSRSSKGKAKRSTQDSSLGLFGDIDASLTGIEEPKPRMMTRRRAQQK